MSYERKDGKDTIIFLSEKESNEAAKISLTYDKDDEEHMGLIRPDGEINWNCPCLQGMADGPCGPEFKESFSCFHYSEADPKGSDCIDQFRSMQECFMKYPEVYDFDDDKEGDGEESKSISDQSSNQDEKPSINDSSPVENDSVKIEEVQQNVESSPNTHAVAIDGSNKKAG